MPRRIGARNGDVESSVALPAVRGRPLPGSATKRLHDSAYEITQGVTGRVHRREKKTGQFALDAYCGLP